MAAVKIDPMKLAGPWSDGYVLERQHTLTSDFLGHDSFGNPQFDTKRTELGELVFRLKNRNDKNTLDPIAETAVQFIKGWAPSFDLIVPVPPSRKRLAYQPVVEIAKAIGARLSKPVTTAAVSKIKDTPELKDVLTISSGSSCFRAPSTSTAMPSAASASCSSTICIVRALRQRWWRRTSSQAALLRFTCSR